MIYDAPLSETGLSQANKLQSTVAEFAESVELIVCSPLSRAIHTMQLAFPNIKCPVIITPLARERGDKTCDIGIPLSEIRQKNPQYDYFHFENEYWWNCDPNSPFEFLKESKESLVQRQKELVDFLKTRQEKVVVIISHGQFIKTLVGKKMQIKNCGIKKIRLDELNR